MRRTQVLVAVGGLAGMLLLTSSVQAQAAAVKDRGKNVIERPTQDLVAKAAPRAEAFVNPKVQPGKVRWHRDFAEACIASGKSGKPVLLFQMMGRLDDRFC